MKNRNKKIMFFSAFRHVVPADYEHWFEELAVSGWYPKKIGQWSSVAMFFIKSKPKNYRYVVDMQSVPKKDYKQFYKEFGWEYVGQMASAHVWRKEYTEKRPESFSDALSLKARNQRFIGAVSVSLSIFLLGGIAFSLGMLFGRLTPSDRLQFGIASAFCFISAIVLSLVIGRIRKNIER